MAYDQMQQQRTALRQPQKPKRTSQQSTLDRSCRHTRYAEIENEKVFERKLVKEAEAEAHLYGDKEKF